MPRPIYRGFRGDYLRELREAKGWTQEQLAVRIGAFPTMIGKWERGEVTPGGASVAKLAGCFGVRPQDFSRDDPATLSLVELRVRAGLTRAQAATASGVSQRRLTALEHASSAPALAEAEVLDRLYGVEGGTVTAAWARDRAEAYPGLDP